MGHTYTKLHYHLVFGTKGRQMSIAADLEPRLHEYLGGIVRGLEGVAVGIGGMPDHVHLLVRGAAEWKLPDALRILKSRSSAWVHDTFPAFRDFSWQAGYGAFTVSESQVETLRHYIATQKVHHRGLSFEEEFKRLLDAHGIPYDKRYLFD